MMKARFWPVVIFSAFAALALVRPDMIFDKPGAVVTPEPTLGTQGPHGGQVFQDGRNQYELSQSGGQVSLYTLKMFEPLPKDMKLTLFWDPNRAQEIDLHAVSSIHEPYQLYAGSSAGTLSLQNESFSGAALSFGVNSFPRKLMPVG